MLLMDTHADTLYRMAMRPREARDVTLDSLKKGGVSAQTLAMFVGGKPELPAIARAFDKMLAAEEGLRAQGWTRLDDYRDAREDETAYVLSVEGCDLLGKDPSLLEDWRRRGVRMAALTWNYENALATPAKADDVSPLKPFGKEAVRSMQRLGIAPDVSHLNRRGFFDLLEMGAVPLASHSCCQALCDHSRNLTDDQLRALFSAGGYVGINFYPAFLSPDGQADIETICDHVIHAMELGGEKQTGFGSDFDGIERKPRDMAGPQAFPRLLDALRRRGLTDELIAGLSGHNLMAYYDRIDPR